MVEITQIVATELVLESKPGWVQSPCSFPTLSYLPQAHYKLYDSIYVVIFWRPEIYTHRTELLPELCSPIMPQISNSLWAHTPTCSHFPHVYLDVVTNYIPGRCHLEKKPWSLSKKSEKCFKITLMSSPHLRVAHLLKQKILAMFPKCGLWTWEYPRFFQGVVR